MLYKEYIELGFTRYDISCSVEFGRTGYSGFELSKAINDRIRVIVFSGELDKPQLYVRMLSDTERYHIMPITTDMVKAIFSKTFNNNFIYAA